MIPTVFSVGERITCRHHQTNRFKADTLSVSFLLPIQKETTYLTSLLLSTLLRGSRRYPTVQDINRRLDELYGAELSVRNYYRGDCQIVGLTASFLGRDYLPTGETESLVQALLELIRELLFCPLSETDPDLFCTYVESEKNLQCDTIRAEKNQPGTYALERARSLMYENEPTGVSLYGSVDEVMRVTPDMLEAHRKTLLSALSLHVFYIGTQPSSDVRQALEHTLLPSLPDTKTTFAPSLFSGCAASRKLHRAEETLPIKQGRLAIGLRTDATIQTKDFYAMAMCNVLLGESPVSKLFVHVRENLSLCYSCSSTYNAYKGSIMICSGLLSKNRERAEREIFAQIEAIANGDFDEQEWQAAQKTLLHAYREISDSPTAMENYDFGRALARIDQSVEDCIEDFLSVTREDVMRVAKNLRTSVVFFLRESLEGEEDCDEED